MCKIWHTTIQQQCFKSIRFKYQKVILKCKTILCKIVVIKIEIIFNIQSKYRIEWYYFLIHNCIRGIIGFVLFFLFFFKIVKVPPNYNFFVWHMWLMARSLLKLKGRNYRYSFSQERFRCCFWKYWFCMAAILFWQIYSPLPFS